MPIKKSEARIWKTKIAFRDKRDVELLRDILKQKNPGRNFDAVDAKNLQEFYFEAKKLVGKDFPYMQALRHKNARKQILGQLLVLHPNTDRSFWKHLAAIDREITKQTKN